MPTTTLLRLVAHLGACMLAGVPLLVGCGPPTLVTRQLMTLEAGKGAADFRAEGGEVPTLLIGVPASADSTAGDRPLRGTATVTARDATGLQFAIGPASLQRANWLEPAISEAYVISSSSDGLEETWRRGREYRLEVHLDPPPPEGTTVWLAWVE